MVSRRKYFSASSHFEREFKKLEWSMNYNSLGLKGVRGKGR